MNLWKDLASTDSTPLQQWRESPPEKNCFRTCGRCTCPLITVAKPDDTAADAVTVAFVEARQAAHLPKVSRIGRNAFGEEVCIHDLRMPSGLVKDVLYESTDPTLLSDAARQLATFARRAQDRCTLWCQRVLVRRRFIWESQVLSPYRNVRIALDQLLANFLGVSNRLPPLSCRRQMDEKAGLRTGCGRLPSYRRARSARDKGDALAQRQRVAYPKPSWDGGSRGFITA
jgi:hypothetical protein